MGGEVVFHFFGGCDTIGLRDALHLKRSLRLQVAGCIPSSRDASFVRSLVRAYKHPLFDLVLPGLHRVTFSEESFPSDCVGGSVL